MTMQSNIEEHTAESGARIVLTDDKANRDALCFRSMLKSYILPLFHSANIEGPFTTAEKRESDNPFPASKSIALQVIGHPHIQFLLSRDVPFTAQEKELLRSVMEGVRGQSATLGRWNHASLCNCIERAIAQEISAEYAEVILLILHVYAQWAAETYEGRRIAHTVGICGNITWSTKYLY